MTYSDFAKKIKTFKHPTYEAEFPKSVKTPFLVYLKGNCEKITADGAIVLQQDEVFLELYTERKDTSLQTELEEFLKSNGLSFKMKDRLWISEEKFYMTSYRGFLNERHKI